VVSARGHRVGLAAGAFALLGVVTAGGHTGLSEPLPGTGGLTTVAAHGHLAVQARAASQGVLGGEDGLGITGGNAATVVERLGGAEGPAGAAAGLVADVANQGGALGPLSADIEGLGNGGDGSGEGLRLRSVVALLSGHHSAEKLLHVSNGGVGESGGHGGLPGGLHVLLSEHIKARAH
jgi:hypothetical protein